MEFKDRVAKIVYSLDSLAISLTKDRESANDLIQETALHAFKNEGKFQVGTNLNAWVYTLMKNIFINNYRKTDRLNKYTHTDIVSTVSNCGESNINMEGINKALTTIPAHHRVCFQLYFVGFKYHEIAQQLELPLGTVRSRIHHARMGLQKQLNRY